jgi:hypothetical protein
MLGESPVKVAPLEMHIDIPLSICTLWFLAYTFGFVISWGDVHNGEKSI